MTAARDYPSTPGRKYGTADGRGPARGSAASVAIIGLLLGLGGVPARSPAQTPVPAPAYHELRTTAAETALPLPTTTASPAPSPGSGPTSYGWPLNQGAPQIPGAPQAEPAVPGLLPPSTPLPTPNLSPLGPPLLEATPTPFSGPSATVYEGPLLDAEGQRPLPGSLEENLNREAAARRGFRYCTWNDYRLTLFPQTLLWTPPFADLRAPRLGLLFTDEDRFSNNYTVDTTVGTTVGLLRIDTPGHDLAYQFDFFAMGQFRTTPQDLLTTDVRFGLPLTWQWGRWHGKLGYERTQSHLADDFLRLTNQLPGARFVRNEVVLGLDRQIDDLRVYGTASYAFSQQGMPDPEKKWRFDAGFEYLYSGSTGFDGTPFVAVHTDFREMTGYNATVSAQVGWLWRNPFQRLASLRVYATYVDGRSHIGQFAFDREKYYGFGLAGDF